MAIRTLIVDDEPLARERIRTLLAAEPDVRIIGECADGKSAVTAIRGKSPELLFLDVQMPEMDGFAVLEALRDEPAPVVIFVTAYDRYALRAFDVHAIDYLLKPFDRERFHRALHRAREAIQGDGGEQLSRRLLALLQDVRAEPRYLQRLVIKSGGRVFFLRVEEIDWIEAAGNYLRLHVGRSEHLLRDTMNRIESQLDPEQFLRIHRSTIVNLERVKELQPSFHGDYLVLLHDGRRLTLSRNYRARLQELLGKAV